MTDYKALYEAQVEENKTLKQEIDDLIQKEKDGSVWEDIVEIVKEAASKKIKAQEEEIKELKEEHQNLQMNHIDMKCEISGTTLTEDDLQMSLEIGRLICESAYDDLDDDDKKTREELQEKITCLESDSMNEVSQAEFDDMVQEKDDEIKEIKKKSMKSISKLGRENKDLKKQLSQKD